MPKCGDCIHFNKGFCEKGMVNGQIPPKQPSCERYETIHKKVPDEADTPMEPVLKVSGDSDECIHGLKEADPSICNTCVRYTMRMGICPLIEKAIRQK